MLYLLDANVLIRTNNAFYPIDRIPQFWDWLQNMGENGVVKLPSEIYNEIAQYDDLLANWAKRTEVQQVLLLNERANQSTLSEVVEKGYGTKLSVPKLARTGADPFLITYALMGNNRTVVTREISKPKKTGVNIKIPDVCNSLNIPWMVDFEFYKTLDFRIP